MDECNVVSSHLNIKHNYYKCDQNAIRISKRFQPAMIFAISILNALGKESTYIFPPPIWSFTQKWHCKLRSITQVKYKRIFSTLAKRLSILFLRKKKENKFCISIILDGKKNWKLRKHKSCTHPICEVTRIRHKCLQRVGLITSCSYKDCF